MRLSKTTVIILISMFIFSILFAHLLSSQVLTSDGFKNEKFKEIGKTDANLIWFLQITDIHLSVFTDPLRITQFKEFCHYTVDAIKPLVVLASGDLTDAKTRDSIGSQQIQREWEYYRDILKECHIQEKTVWLDIRGNHDNFNVAGRNSSQNFYPKYSIQGKEHSRSYMYQVEKDKLKYSFVAIDACLEPGPRRPFNFVGVLDKTDINDIRRFINTIKSSRSNYTIWFGHFPTSCILTYGRKNVRQLIQEDPNALVYVCGHLHKLGGFVPQMYTLQNEGFLELELGDWKDNRMYRLLAIDHGMLSFTDVNFGDWPVILVTNPKHALFVNPLKENLETLAKSTFIRVLAFSLSEIVTVKVRLNKGIWIYCKHVKGPLYVSSFNSNFFQTGIHEIEVFVKDKDGRQKFVQQPFSLDGSRLSFGALPSFILMNNVSVMFRVMFGILSVMSVLPLFIIRYMHKLVEGGKLQKPKQVQNCCTVWLRKLWFLCTVDRIFWPIVFYPIYLSIGPWCVGYIIEDHIGIIFSWGIIVRGTYLPGSFTYVYGFVQLVTFQLPLTLILAHGVDHRFQYQVLKPGKRSSLCTVIWLHLPFVIIFGLQLTMAYLFWLAYGTLAFILGPLRSWSVILAAMLWYITLTLPVVCTRRAAVVWSPKTEGEGTDVLENTVSMLKSKSSIT